MLKRKIMSILLLIAMLVSTSVVSVSADTTTADAISSVITDSTNFMYNANQHNRLFGYRANSDYAVLDEGKEQACFKATVGTSGITSDSAFYMNYITVGADNKATAYGSYNIASATKPIYWSVDVYGNSITDIRMQAGPYKMHPSNIMANQLKADQWNTLAIVYYPDTTEGATTCGYADLYINGVFQGTTSLNTVPTSTTQTRFYYKFATQDAGTNGVKFDNFKIYEMTSFTRPTIDTSKVTVTNGQITNYVTETRRATQETKTGSNVARSANTISKYDATVATVEALLGGAEITNADGSVPARTDNVAAGMKVKTAPTTITGVGTFTDTAEYTLSNIAETYIDATNLTSWGNGWNRIMGAVSSNMVQAGTYAGTSVIDGNTVAAYKLNGNLGDTSFIKMAECYWNTATTTQPIPIDISTATTPIYASIDVYDDDTLTDIGWKTGGGMGIGTTVTMDKLNANAWNTFAVVYYPNLTDSTKLGYADAYLNGKFIGTSNLSEYDSWTYGGEIRLAFKYTKADTAAYFDNHKCYAVTAFARPKAITVPSGATVENGTLKGYIAETVAELETATGADIVNADGTDATATDAPVAGMKALTSSTVADLGTYSNEYVLGTGGYQIGDWSCTLNGEALEGNTYTAGSLNAKLPVKNSTGANVKLTVIIAEYNGDRCLNAAVAPTTITAFNGYAELNYTLTAGHTYKLFAWESMDTLTPLKPVKTFTE